MRSGVVSVLVLAACGFHGSGAAPGDGQPPHSAAPDAPGNPDATTDAAAPAFCDPADPHLMVCYEFENDGHDGSMHHLDAMTTSAPFVPGHVGQAMQFGATSMARVNDSPVLDISTITIEAWIRPSQLPTTGRAGIIDVDRQYGLFFYPGGMLSCTLSGGPTVTAASTTLAANHWSHVACTYDRAMSILYVDGSVVGRATGSAAPSAAGTTGMSIASDNPSGNDRLIGLIDQVRLFDVAHSAAQICADAGKASCP
jgi:hypothetical protein